MSNIDLNTLRERMHTYTHAHSFQNKEFSDEHFFDVELSDEHLLMLVIVELADAVKADRENKRSNYTRFKAAVNFQAITTDEMWKEAFEAYIKNTVEDELADAVIRLLDLAGHCRVNITVKEIDLEDDTVREAYTDKTFTEAVYDMVVLLPRYDGNYDLPAAIDSMIFSLFAFSKHLGIDLLWHIEQKMKYNEFRGYKHGKRY